MNKPSLVERALAYCYNGVIRVSMTMIAAPLADTQLKMTAPFVTPGLVRVRIAPSPTGLLHLGTARTALFNYLFAKKYGGTFMVRIEDTDLERSDRKFEEDIVAQLRWLGIAWDEGIEVGGNYGPYRQSERQESYKPHIEKLLSEKKAYFCFCDEKTLEQERQQQLEKGRAPIYSGTCAKLSPEEMRQRIEKKERSVIRFRMRARTIAFDDLIRGPIEYDAGLFGDIVIARNATTPLYNLAVVIDDCDMRITHVIRGEDHLPNTPKQIALAEALGFSLPQFAHLPLILGPDRTKLSKRHGATSVEAFRTMGYLPEALVNFMALLGWNPGTEEEIFTLDELVRAFDLSRVQKSGAIWNQQKLDWFNSHFSKSEKRWLTKTPWTQEFIARMSNAIVTLGLAEKVGAKEQRLLEYIAPLILERVSLAQFDENAFRDDFGFFFRQNSYDATLLYAWKSMGKTEAYEMLTRAKNIVEKIPEDAFANASLVLDMLSRAMQNNRGALLWPLRVALSGQKNSPGPHEIAAALGKKETLVRITHAIGELRDLKNETRP